MTKNLKIENMAFICALLVVCQHVGVQSWARDHISIFTRVAVPFFFCVSGYFLVGHTDQKNWWRDAITKRVRTLLVPYLFFSFTWYLVSHMLWTRDFSVREFAVSMGGSPVHLPLVGPLWYIRDLLIFAFILPLAWKIISKSRTFTGILLVALAIIAVCFNWWSEMTDVVRLSNFLKWGFSFTGLFWFLLGASIRKWNCENLEGRFLRGGICAAVCVCVFYYGGIIPRSGLVANLFDFLAKMIMMYAVWHVMSRRSWPPVFVRNTFPLYLMHWQVGACLASFLKLCSIKGSIVDWGMFIVTIVVCLFIAELVRKWAPVFAGVIFGGR